MENKTGNIYLYVNNTHNLVNLNEYINTCNDKNNICLFRIIKEKITTFEQPGPYFDGKYLSRYHSDDEIMGEKNIIITEDSVCMCVNVSRWRNGFGFTFLQFSGKNNGSVHVYAFMTDTVHHSAASFGTTPDVDDAENMIKKYIDNIDTDRVDFDLFALTRKYHSTRRYDRVEIIAALRNEINKNTHEDVPNNHYHIYFNFFNNFSFFKIPNFSNFSSDNDN